MMAEVSITIAGRQYDIFCEDGEEAELIRLASIVDGKARQANDLVGSVNEARTLLFAALFLADETGENAGTSSTQIAQSPAPPATTDADLTTIAQALDKLAARIESLANVFDQY